MCAVQAGEAEPKRYISQDIIIHTETDILYLPVTANILYTPQEVFIALVYRSGKRKHTLMLVLISFHPSFLRDYTTCGSRNTTRKAPGSVTCPCSPTDDLVHTWPVLQQTLVSILYYWDVDRKHVTISDTVFVCKFQDTFCEEYTSPVSSDFTSLKSSSHYHLPTTFLYFIPQKLNIVMHFYIFSDTIKSLK